MPLRLLRAVAPVFGFVFFVVAAVGCGGGGGDVPVDNRPPVRAEATGINDDPHWLINNPQQPLDHSFFGYASPRDLTAYGISRVRFPLYVDGDDLDRAFALYDPIIAAYRAGGVHVLIVLGGMTVSLDPANANAVPQDLIDSGRWHDFVVRFATVANLVADHYDGEIDAYEIMNEMNVTNGAARYIAPGAYGELLQWAHDAIAGRARVVVGGLYGRDEDGQSPGASYLANVNLDYADAIAVHPYGYWPGPAESRPARLADWGTFEEVLAPLAGFGKPIWLTEWNIADDNLGQGREQVDGKKLMFSNFFNFVAGDSRVDQAYFFAWSDHNEAGFGLVDDTGAPKPYVDELRNDLQQQIAAAPLENLRGDVVDAATGAPVAPPFGVTIYPNGSSGVRVRADGTFELPGMAPGQPRTLVALNDGGTLGYGVWDTVIPPGVGSPGTIHVLLPPESSDPSQPTGSVSGTVLDVHSGMPLTSARANGAGIFVYCGGKRVRLGADGTYTLGGLRPGQHAIIAANIGGSYRFGSTTWSVGVVANSDVKQDLFLPPM